MVIQHRLSAYRQAPGWTQATAQFCDFPGRALQRPDFRVRLSRGDSVALMRFLSDECSRKTPMRNIRTSHQRADKVHPDRRHKGPDRVASKGQTYAWRFSLAPVTPLVMHTYQGGIFQGWWYSKQALRDSSRSMGYRTTGCRAQGSPLPSALFKTWPTHLTTSSQVHHS